MRWKQKPEIKLDATRIKHKLFLFLPLTLQGETRWFEPVSIKQVYKEFQRKNIHTDCPYLIRKWVHKEWVD